MMADLGWWLAKTLGTLAVITGALLMLARFATRWQPRGDEALRVARRLMLGPKAGIWEIEHSSGRYLILQSGDELRPLPPEAAFAPPKSPEKPDA